jgi:PHS family inorganic phosphate transporter-like MFS transporter
LLKPVGIKKLQIIGFIMISVCFTIMAFLYYPLKKQNPDLLFAFYCLLLFSLSFGTNATTYLLSAEMYPKEIRATFNGISAACGKLGAIFGAYIFDILGDLTTTPTVMVLCAALSLLGAFVSWKYIVGLDEDESQDQDSFDNNDSLVKSLE